MENLAKAIVDSAHLLGQVIVHLGNNQAGTDTANNLQVASTIVTIFGNLASFVGQLSLEIAKLIT